MYARQTEWLELQQLTPGQEVSWQGGALRLALTAFEVEREKRGWLSRKLVVNGYHFALMVTAPGHGRFDCRQKVWAGRGFPERVGPFREPPPGLLATTRSPMFELHDLLDEHGRVLVRAGFEIAPPAVQVSGHLRALDPAARRFVEWWQAASHDLQWAAVEGEAVTGQQHLEGYAMRVGIDTTGARVVTFHRSGEWYYVRTYGGCIAAVEQWYGPYIEGAGEYWLAQGRRGKMAR